MWGDDVFYWLEDRFIEIDDHIRALNEWWADHGLSWLRYLSLWGTVGGESAFPVPPFAHEMWKLLAGENPRADENRLRDLVQYWADEATRTAETASEAARAAQGVSVVWLGDGAPWVFEDQMRALSEAAAGLSRTQADLATNSAQFVTIIVQAKAAFRAQVLLLLFELVTALATATLRGIMRTFLAKLGQVQFRNSIRHLVAGGVGRAGTVRLGAGGLPRLAMPAWPG